MTFEFFSPSLLQQYTVHRDREMKLGEKLVTISGWADLLTSKAQFVVLGIAEDVGPRANCGHAGAENAWESFLKKFLNMQANHLLSGENIVLAGVLRLSNQSDDIDALRTVVDELDDEFRAIIAQIVAHDKIPIVIGGGHNNCYPIIKAISLEKKKAISVINIDPHADLRPLEGRHSGNGFTAAIDNHFLSFYYIIGLHEQYNSAYIWNKILTSSQIACSTYESFLDQPNPLQEADRAIQFCGNRYGVEIDMDAISGMPASAFTPSGFRLDEVRSMIRKLAQNGPYYLHLPEAAPTNAQEELITGKALAYLVADFVKSYPY